MDLDLNKIIDKFLATPSEAHIESHRPTYRKLDDDSSLSTIVNGRLDKADARFWRFLHESINKLSLSNAVVSIIKNRLVRVNGIECTDYTSCSYLGLDKNPYLIECAKQALDVYGTHFATSRIFSSTENVIQLESEIAALVGAEASLVGVNCHQIHQGVLGTLFGSPNATIFRDKFAHMTMVEAALVAKSKGAKVVKVDSQNLQDLENTFAKATTTKNVLLVDGMYSMSGIVLDLVALQKVCNRHGVVLYIDDAHGIGIYGKNGGGVVEHCQLNYDNMILVGGLQKGLASHGAFVAGKAPLIDLLRSANTTFFQYSGTLQPQTVECVRAAIRLVRSEEGATLRKYLLHQSEVVRRELTRQGFVLTDAYSPIISIRIGETLDTLIAGRYLLSQGVFVNSAIYPAVPRDAGGLRVCLNAIHSLTDIDKLVAAFGELAAYLRSKEMAEMKSAIEASMGHLS